MKVSKIIVSFLLILCSVSIPITAQDDNDSYREFVRQRNKDFKDWRSKANSEFADYLSKAWSEFLIHTGHVDPIGAVPDKPTYYHKEDASVPQSHGYPSDVDMAFPAETPSDAISASYSAPAQSVEVDFFGMTTSIPFDASMKIYRIGANERDVANGWNTLSNSSFEPTLEALNEAKSDLNLNDWATYVLIKKITEAVFSDNYINERTLTQMFLLCQMEYQVRVGAAGDNLILLLPFEEPVYSILYITDDDNQFYIFSYKPISDQTPLYTFHEDLSFADSKFLLTVGKPLNVSQSFYEKKDIPLWAAILGDDFSVPIPSPYISFALDYPQSELLTYHKSAVNEETSKAIIRAVKYKILKDQMNQVDAVTFIMNLMHHGFEYKTDYEMFGRAKPLFVEESFFYGSNNCKDRVLIFSWLIKNILHLNTVLLGYEGHVACGVEFPVDVPGDAFIYNGHRYVMCDPTYVNAPIGMTMPQYKGIKPTLTIL